MTVAAGVDGCRGGWIAAFAEAGELPRIAVFRTFAGLVDALPNDAVIAVDMPIGLPEHCRAGGRGPETLVRPLLGMRQSSVFSIPSRAAVYATAEWPPPDVPADDDGWLAAHRHASTIARRTSDPPRAVSIQAFGLFGKIRELDTLLRERASLPDRVIESHPELCFWRLNSRKPLAEPKKVKGRIHPAGMHERKALLRNAGLEAGLVDAPPPSGAGEDDRLDALAVMTAARNRIGSDGLRFPDPPPLDAHGLPICISC
jgi:predicted RNase H-like nuclease